MVCQKGVSANLGGEGNPDLLFRDIIGLKC